MTNTQNANSRQEALLESMPELVELNADLLRNPASIANPPLVQSHFERDPELLVLCPFARAIFRLDKGICTRREAEAALATCWLVDDSAIHRPEEWEPGDNLEACETVEHFMDAHLQGRTISLAFHSEADLLYSSEEYKNHITAATAADLLAEHGDASPIWNPADSISWLASKAGEPLGCPEGKDEPLCSISYRLIAIGGIKVAGPVLVNTYNEISLEDLNDAWQQRPEDEAYCWLHALDESQAVQLGIATTASTSDPEDPEECPAYPAWAPLEANLEAT
jgi:hypothetical protein